MAADLQREGYQLSVSFARTGGYGAIFASLGGAMAVMSFVLSLFLVHVLLQERNNILLGVLVCMLVLLALSAKVWLIGFTIKCEVYTFERMLALRKYHRFEGWSGDTLGADHKSHTKIGFRVDLAQNLLLVNYNFLVLAVVGLFASLLT
jgi:cobalamin synthase